jgi:hypothetical protein
MAALANGEMIRVATLPIAFFCQPLEKFWLERSVALLISKQLCVFTWTRLDIKMIRLVGGNHA